MYLEMELDPYNMEMVAPFLFDKMFTTRLKQTSALQFVEVEEMSLRRSRSLRQAGKTEKPSKTAGAARAR